MDEAKTKALEIAVAFLGALPQELKLKLSFPVGHDPERLLSEVIPKYAAIIESHLTGRKAPKAP